MDPVVAIIMFGVGLVCGALMMAAAVWGILTWGRSIREQVEHDRRLLDNTKEGIDRAHKKLRDFKDENIDRQVAGTRWHDWGDQDWH